MPALVNSSVGASSGTTGDDGTKVCPCFLQKKSMNCWRISFAVGIAVSVMRVQSFSRPSRTGAAAPVRDGRLNLGRSNGAVGSAPVEQAVAEEVLQLRDG